jgi:hypothetical protein
MGLSLISLMKPVFHRFISRMPLSFAVVPFLADDFFDFLSSSGLPQCNTFFCEALEAQQP